MLKKPGVKCPCGSVVAIDYLEKHQQTRLHFKRLEKKNHDKFKRIVGVQKVYF